MAETTMDYAEGLRTAIAIAQAREEQADALSAELASNPNAKPGAALEWEHRGEEAEAIVRELKHALEGAPSGWRVIRGASADSPTECLPPDGVGGLYYRGSICLGWFDASTRRVHYDDHTVGRIEDHDGDGWHPLPDTEPAVAIWREARAKKEVQS